MVSALYVDVRNGPYVSMGVDCWGIERDATQYDGNVPIVAHPPCGPWSAHLRHQYKGNEHALAPFAVQQVRYFGGVLEHPAYSKLWEYCQLPLPYSHVDAWGGYTIEVEQVDWGHLCRKRTWIYCVGVPYDLTLVRPPKRKPTHKMCTPATGGLLVCPARLNHLTPPLFAWWLCYLAASVRRAHP